tara:strand:- start:83 stop:184 length:102 start_codon:yes stop_codon:yes gene_type:complete
VVKNYYLEEGQKEEENLPFNEYQVTESLKESRF